MSDRNSRAIESFKWNRYGRFYNLAKEREKRGM